MIARPNSEHKEQSKTAAIHVADTVITNDTLPYVMVSAEPGI